MLSETTSSHSTPGNTTSNDTTPGGCTPIDTTTPVVVLKLDRSARHDGGLGAIRSLGRLGVPVYGVHQQPWAPAASSRYLCGSWYWRPAADDAQRLRDGLATLAQRIGRRAVLIATDDAGAIFLAEHGADLRDRFLFPDPPADLPRRLAGKYTLHQLCLELGVPTVHAAVPTTPAHAREFADQVGFPLVAKPTTAFGSDDMTRPQRAVLVHTQDELERICRPRRPDAEPNLMLQEYIPRCPSQDFFFHGYFDAYSRCRPGFVGIKERSYPVHTGSTCLGRWVDNPELYKQATELVARLGYQGIVDLDYRWDPRDGQYKLLDFKPRLGAQFRVFADAAGVDMAVASHLDLTGRPVSSGSPVPGRRLLVENVDPIAALDYRRRGELNLLFWATSLRLVDELAWYARDDLAPFGMMCLRTGWRAMTNRLARRLTGRRSTVVSTAKPPRYLPGRAPQPQSQPQSQPDEQQPAQPNRWHPHQLPPLEVNQPQLPVPGRPRIRELLAFRQ